ncbi:MAG TPA: hypothetical protein VF707_16165 [Ardenticatenaceae bacterium]
MIEIGENRRALANLSRVALAEIESRSGRLRFQMAPGTPYGAGPDPRTLDIGRTLSVRAGGLLRTVRLWHTETGFAWRAWAGDPATATPTEGESLLGSFAGQCRGAWMETDGTNWHTFITHCPTIAQLEIFRLTNGAALGLYHAAVSLPPDMNAASGGYTGFAIVDRRTLFLIHIHGDGKHARIWEGTFATVPLNGAITWAELPYRVAAGHPDDRFKAAPGAGEALDRRAANGFDAVRFGGKTIVLCQDHAAGRSQVLVKSEAGIWADPLPIIPMDFVDEGNHLFLSRFLVKQNTLLATGTLARNGMLFDCLLRSADGQLWSVESDALIAPALGAPHHGQLIADPQSGRIHYLATDWTRSLATAPAESTKVAPYYVTIERGAQSVPTAEIEIPVEEGIGPEDDDLVTVRLGYEARANLVPLGEFGLDRVSETRSWEGARRTLHLRERHGKALHDWASPYTFDFWGQSKAIVEFESKREYEVTAGEPRASIKRVRLAQPFDTSQNTIVLEAIDGDPPATIGEMLRYRVGSLATRVRIAGQPTGAGPFSYPVVVEQGDIVSFPAGTELACDELFLGRRGQEDRIVLDLARRFRGQFGSATLRFSEHDHRYGESVSLLLHRADDDNSYRVRYTKINSGGAPGLGWEFERVTEGSATLLASGSLMDGGTPLSGVNRALYVRWRVQNGRVTLWASPTTLYGSPLVDYVEDTILPSLEGGVGFSGRADSLTHFTTSELGGQSGATAPDNCLILDTPATAFPNQGALIISGRSASYSARSLQERHPVEPISPMTDITLSGFRSAHRWEGDLTTGDLGWWYLWDTLSFDATGMVACVRARKGVYMDNNGELRTHGVADEYARVTHCERTYDDSGTTRTRLRLTKTPDKNRTQMWWGYEPPELFESGGWLVGIRFYPCFQMETDNWPNIPSTQPVMLDMRPEQPPLGTAIDRVELCDLERDLALAEGVQAVARLAGVEVAADTLPTSAWGLESDANWTVSFVNNLPRLVGMSGTKLSAFTLVDGLFRARLRLGQAGLSLHWDGGGTVIRFAPEGVEFRDLVNDTLRASIPYIQGAGADKLVTARVSIEGPFLSVWLDDAFAAFYVDERLRGCVKRLGVVAYVPTIIEWIEVAEAYEKLGRFLIPQGATAAESIAAMVGERRLGLLFRANRVPRFGTLEQREHLEALLGTILVTSEERDDAAVRTLAQVRGARDVAEAALGAEVYGLRFVAIENPDLLTADGCAREARAILRQTQEQARTATVEMRADLRVENEDHCTALIGDTESGWIVDSSSITFLVSPEDAALDMRLGLRSAL